MSRSPSANLDGLRPAEKAIYQRLRSLIGRTDVEEMAAHLRRAHPVWSDVYNITSDRIVEVLERAGLAAEIRFAPPAAKPAAPPSPKARQKKNRAVAESLPLLPIDEPPAVPPANSQESPGRTAAATPATPQPARAASGAPAQRRNEPTPIAATVESAVPLTRAQPTEPARPRSVLRSHSMNQVEEPVEQTTRPTATEDEPADRKARPTAKKRPASSVDELLQQMDVIADDIGRVHAEIDQANRRIADLERRRQILSDQLAMTLRSRVPVEILRLAATEPTGNAERTESNRRRSG